MIFIELFNIIISFLYLALHQFYQEIINLFTIYE